MIVIIELVEKHIAGATVENLSNMLTDKIAVWRENAIILLDASTILYFTMIKKKVAVYTMDYIYESSNSLDDFEQRLYGKGFFRCHKSFIVNMNYVERIVPWFNSTYMMKLKAPTEQIPVSRHYTRKLRELLRI